MDKLVDRCLAAFLLLFAIGNLAALPNQQWTQHSGPKVLAPAFFPEFLFIGLALVSVLLLAATFIERDYRTDYDAPRLSGVVLGIALLAFALAVPHLGFVVSAMALCLVVMIAMGERRIVRLIAVSAAAPLVMTWLAGQVLHVCYLAAEDVEPLDEVLEFADVPREGVGQDGGPSTS